jgi:type VI protein secretion system component Hcp
MTAKSKTHLKKGKKLEATKPLKSSSSPNLYGNCTTGKHIIGGKLST